MKPLSAILVTGMLCAACAATPEQARDLLGQADAKLEAKDYRAAIALYSEFLRTDLQHSQAARARATQAALDRLLALETELDRVQREYSDRQSETDRLKGEVSKLRADLERLRNIDLNELQRGGKK